MSQLLQRNLESSLFCHFVFSCITSQFSPFISIYFLIWFIHPVLGLPRGRFASIFMRRIFLGIPSSLIHITCPNHLNLLLWMSFFISSTLSLSYVSVINTSLFVNHIARYQKWNVTWIVIQGMAMLMWITQGVLNLFDHKTWPIIFFFLYYCTLIGNIKPGSPIGAFQ